MILQLSALGLFAQANSNEIDERLKLAQKIEMQRREDIGAPKAKFSGFFVFHPSSQFGCLTLHRIDFKTNQINKSVCTLSDFRKRDLLVHPDFLEKIRGKRCLLDYEKQQNLVPSVSGTKLTTDEWNTKFEELKQAVETSPYYSAHMTREQATLLSDFMLCFRPSSEKNQLAVSYKHPDEQEVKHGILTLNEYGQVIVCGSVYDSFNAFLTLFTSFQGHTWTSPTN